MKSLIQIALLCSAICVVIISCGAERKNDKTGFEKLRDQMVALQIENRGIKDTATLRAMRTVKRHLFVPDNLISDAYDDGPLPIGYGQTISQPYIVAYMTELIRPRHGHKVLEIGTGSGYQAAVLSEIVDSVFSVEIIPELGNAADERLKNLGYNNTFIMIDDGYNGWKEHAPYDAIIVTAASEYMPPPLLEQLKDGGKMVIPIGSPFMTQWLLLVEKNGDKFTTNNMIPVRFVPFRRTK